MTTKAIPQSPEITSSPAAGSPFQDAWPEAARPSALPAVSVIRQFAHDESAAGSPYPNVNAYASTPGVKRSVNSASASLSLSRSV
jgi:hypothetical protein